MASQSLSSTAEASPSSPFPSPNGAEHVSLKWYCFVLSWDYCLFNRFSWDTFSWNASPFSISFCRNYRRLFLLSSALYHPVFSLPLLPPHVLAKVWSSHCGMCVGLGKGGGGGMYGLLQKVIIYPSSQSSSTAPCPSVNVYGLCWDNSLNYSLVWLQACNTAWAVTFSCLPYNGGHIVSIPAPSPYLMLFEYLLQASHRVKSHEAFKDKKGSPKGR